MKNQLSDLATQIRESFPLAKVELDPALHAAGKHHLDVRLGDRLVVVEWDAKRGFGVSLITEAALDASPDFRLVDMYRALACVSLLLSEAQDAEFSAELGFADATVDVEVRREDRRVEKGERRPPWSEAA